jgi:predicted transcriptional regulator of viral defense system
MEKKLIKGDFLDILLRSKQTVFSTKDAALLWGESNGSTISARLNSYVKAGKLIRVRRGFYAKDKDYDRFELATRIYTPSYISFETVLAQAGIIFQYYETIFVASYVNREITVGNQGGQKISFVRMKNYVLSNPAGIEHVNGVAKATKERAFLDRLYVSKDYHFDNLHGIDWEKVSALVAIYHNKRLAKNIEKYHVA